MTADEALQRLNWDDFADVIPVRYQQEIPPQVAAVILRAVRRERFRLLQVLQLSGHQLDPVSMQALAGGWRIPAYVLARKARLVEHFLDAAQRLMEPVGELPMNATAPELIAALRRHIRVARLPIAYGREGPLRKIPATWTAAQLISHLERELSAVREKLKDSHDEETRRREPGRSLTQQIFGAMLDASRRSGSRSYDSALAQLPTQHHSAPKAPAEAPLLYTAGAAKAPAETPQLYTAVAVPCAPLHSAETRA